MYYQVYANNSDVPSKVAFDEEEPSLGRILSDSVAPPRTLASIKRRISRVEETPELANADLFEDISSETPMKDGHISILGTDGPGLSPNEPMAIVQRPIDEVESPSIPDGRYLIKSRVGDLFWNAGTNILPGNLTMKEGYFYNSTSLATNLMYKFLHVRSILQLFKCSKDNSFSKWDVKHYTTNDNISIKSVYWGSRWAGANITGSTVPVPWRLIPADGKYY